MENLDHNSFLFLSLFSVSSANGFIHFSTVYRSTSSVNKQLPDSLVNNNNFDIKLIRDIWHARLAMNIRIGFFVYIWVTVVGIKILVKQKSFSAPFILFDECVCCFFFGFHKGNCRFFWYFQCIYNIKLNSINRLCILVDLKKKEGC